MGFARKNKKLKNRAKLPFLPLVSISPGSMLNSLSKIVIPAAFGLCIATAAAGVAAANVDVRILIDVSGSMKANDPKNLRIPAVRLVAELMPLGATVGIWAFSEQVEPLIAAAIVDEEWKVVAQKAAQKIHSRGQFTDVEAALDAATGDWDSTAGAAGGRHVILLTDGMVDVSKQAADSVASRKRILGSGLARLKSYGAQLHTISLSANSDRDLMTTLAESTDGWAEEVEDAAALQRVFLHMFEQAASPDSVPLIDNRFEVDKSISEMTLLVFRGQSTDPLQLVTPSGVVIVEQSRPDNVNWRAEEGYDLVSVTNPETGGWQINTDPDPDNRVLIVTDLKLEVDVLPTAASTDETLNISARITERGQPLVRQDFLELLKAELLVFGAENQQASVYPISFDAAQSRFSAEHLIDWPSGEYELVIKVDAGTFQREQRAKMRIHGAPLTFTSSVAADGQSLDFIARAEDGLVELGSLVGFVLIARPDGSTDVFDLPTFSNGEVNLSVAAPLNGVYWIEPRVIGRSTSGRVLNFKSATLSTEVSTAINAQALEKEQGSEESAPAPIDWLRSGSIVLVGNVVIALLLGGVWLALGQPRRIPANQVVLQ